MVLEVMKFSVLEVIGLPNVFVGLPLGCLK